MSFVIYHTETTRILRKRWYQKPYETESAAKAGLTRALKKDKALVREDYAISETKQFHENIEKMVTRRHLISGKEFQIATNEAGGCCDPSTETYHSM